MVTEHTFWWLLLLAPAPFWLLPARTRPALLAGASMLWLASREPLGAVVLAAWSISFWYLAPRSREPQARRRGRLLIVAILGYLAFYKYLPELMTGLAHTPALRLALPLGISYFTFKFIHFAVEASRQRLPPCRLGDFLCYVFLFPTFTAGPIERLDHFLEHRSQRFDHRFLRDGLARIVVGLVKKFVLAAALPELGLAAGSPLSAGAEVAALSTVQAWRHCTGTFLTVYLDFSAYSDIAIGASLLFGLRIQENFRWPILAASIGDFWKRWHMTLSGWCQTYVYLPVIGLYRSPFVAIAATFLAIGLWHAGRLSYVCWGLYHAAGACGYLLWLRLRRRRRWRPGNGVLPRLAAVLLTQAFVISSFAFTAMHHEGAAAGWQLYGRLLGLSLATGGHDVAP